MQEDIFDVVDENDQVLEQKPRSAVHAEGLIHRAAHVLVFNDEGELFMQKRAKTKDNWPGAWDSSCSGHVDAGEDYQEAALRELQEELGWRPENDLERLFKLKPSEENGFEFVEVYRVLGMGPFRLNHDEIDIGEWMNIPNLLERVEYTPQRFTPTFLMILDELKARGLISTHKQTGPR